MSEFVAALPMYDWPETREQTDVEWALLRDLLQARGIAAPERLAWKNADLPPVPGGIRDAHGRTIAPDPATLPPSELDLQALWRHPGLLVAQTCWGPMEWGLRDHVQVVGQPDYSTFEGGRGKSYSSAIVMRRSSLSESSGCANDVAPPANGSAAIPLRLLAGVRLAFNSRDSMSGAIALGRDLEALGAGPDIFSELMETGAHLASARAVAEGRADAAAIDCRTWEFIRRHRPEIATSLAVVGWTSLRKGLPFITAASRPAPIVAALRDALAEAGMLAG